MIRLSELTALIQNTLEQTFRSQVFDVIAEIGQVNIKQDKKQAFFELVEKEAEQNGFKARLSANLWRKFELIQQFETATQQRLKAGMEVLFKLQIKFNQVYGLSAEIIHIDPQYTIGALAQAKEKTILQLLSKHPDKVQRIDGVLHSYNQSLTVPLVIDNIALITAQQAEGGIDFLHELQNNRFGYRWNITPFFATMQGDQAPDSIKNAIIQIFNSNQEYDVIVIVRGGGANLDLHAFDHFKLAEIIARCPIPIFTGIGHTRNISLADELAKANFKAPTKVAEELIHLKSQFENNLMMKMTELLTSSSEQIENCKRNLQLTTLAFSVEPHTLLRQQMEWINGLRNNIENFTIRNIVNKKNQLEVNSIPIKHIAQGRIKIAKQSLDPIVQHISSHANHRISVKRQMLDVMDKTIESKDPKVWIQRGYARISSNGKFVSSIEQIDQTQDLTIEMKDGKITTTIKAIEPHGKSK